MSDQLVRAISKDGFVKAAAVSTRADPPDLSGGNGGLGPPAGGRFHDGQ